MGTPLSCSIDLPVILGTVWRKVVGVIVGTVAGALFVGFGVEYWPIFGDPSAERSIGGALAGAVLYGTCMLGIRLVQVFWDRRGVAEAEVPTSRYERGIM